MNDGVHALQRDSMDVPDIACNDVQPVMQRQFIAEPLDIEGRHLVACIQQFGNQD